MSISSELLTLNNTKTAIRTAINNKGGSVTASTPFASYATAIDNLPSGGGDDSTVRDLIERDITSIDIPQGTTTIGSYAFYNCTYLSSVTFPSTVTTIGSYAFSFTGLTNISIPNTVTSIGTQAFANCISATSVTIPSSVNSIGQSAFSGCISLTSIVVERTTPATLNSNAFNNTNNCPIYVPAESVDTYKAANNWSTYASRIQAIPSPTPSVTSITFAQYQEATDPGDWGDIEGCGETVNVDAFDATSSGTFDSDIKAAGIVLVEDNNGNDITSQCTFTSSDYTKTEDSGTYYWSLDTYIGDADAQNPHSATITATYGNLSDTFTIEWTTTSNCSEPDPEEEPEE